MNKLTSQFKEEVDSEDWFWKTFDDCLERSQLHNTQPRRLVAKYFLNLRQHIDADKLRQTIRKDGFDVGIATIYRTLQLLNRAGLAEEKYCKDSKSFIFELNCPHSPYDQLVCKRCGTAIEFEDKEMKRRRENIAKAYGFSLISRRLRLLGYCKRCSDKQARSFLNERG